MDLHGRIMNLRCDPTKMGAEPNQRLAYKVGHRDARHAAAELAQKADACVQALRDGLGRPPERADFEAWAISVGFAYRNEHGFWFYRNGGEGMWEAYCAGAGDQRGRDAVASRDRLNAIFDDMRHKTASPASPASPASSASARTTS